MTNVTANQQETLAERLVSLGQECLFGLRELLRAQQLAAEAEVDIWQFAVELDRLTESGLTLTSVRWLVARGYVFHGEESTADSTGQRSIQLQEGFAFSNSAALILSSQGSEFVRDLLQLANRRPPDAQVEVRKHVAGDGPFTGDLMPEWDADVRELRVGQKLIKSFRVPAANQELILSVFQEEGWPRRIFDPLPPNNSISQARRMHNAISRLNGKQIHRLIRFSGSSNGRGIGWAWISESEADHE